jgi:hypothetical protein
MNLVNKILFPAPPSSYGSNAGNLIFVPPDRRYGVWSSIPCFYLTSSSASSSPGGGLRLLLIWSHGNGTDIGRMYPRMVELMSMIQSQLNIVVDVLAYEYPGYGTCSDQPTSSDRIDSHALLTYHFARHVLGYLPSQIILYGHSIGTGPSVKLASTVYRCYHEVIGGVILQSPYASIRALVNHHTSSEWISNCIRERWNNSSEIRRLSPDTFVTIIHGKKDTLIPYEHARIISHLSCSSQKSLVLIPNADHNVFPVGSFDAPILASLESHIRTHFSVLRTKGTEINSVPSSFTRPRHLRRTRSSPFSLLSWF